MVNLRLQCFAARSPIRIADIECLNPLCSILCKPLGAGESVDLDRTRLVPF